MLPWLQRASIYMQLLGYVHYIRTTTIVIITSYKLGLNKEKLTGAGFEPTSSGLMWGIIDSSPSPVNFSLFKPKLFKIYPLSFPCGSLLGIFYIIYKKIPFATTLYSKRPTFQPYRGKGGESQKFRIPDWTKADC